MKRSKRLTRPRRELPAAYRRKTTDWGEMLSAENASVATAMVLGPARRSFCAMLPEPPIWPFQGQDTKFGGIWVHELFQAESASATMPWPRGQLHRRGRTTFCRDLLLLTKWTPMLVVCLPVEAS